MFKSWWREPRPDEWAKPTEDLQALVYLLRERAGAIAQALEDAADAIEKKIEAQQAGACGHKTEDGRCGDPDRSIAFCIGAACPEAGPGDHFRDVTKMMAEEGEA